MPNLEVVFCRQGPKVKLQVRTPESLSTHLLSIDEFDRLLNRGVAVLVGEQHSARAIFSADQAPVCRKHADAWAARSLN